MTPLSRREGIVPAIKVHGRMHDGPNGAGLSRKAILAEVELLAKDPVVSPIVGATSTGHIDRALGALDLELSAEEIAALEAPYVPHRVVGAQ